MTFKFALETKAFVKALDRVGKVLPTSNASPILHNFYVEIIDGGVRISGTNKSVTLGLSIIRDIAVSEDRSPMLLPSKQTLEIAKKAAHRFIIISTNDDVEDMVTIESKPSKWNLKTFKVESYPVPSFLQESESHEIERQSFLKALTSVRKAMASTFKPSLSQIGVRAGKVTAADGVWFQQCDLSGIGSINTSIPSPVVDSLMALLSGSSADVVSVGTSEDSSMVFKIDNYVLTFRGMVLPFPDVDKTFLVPVMSNRQTLLVDRKTLRDCITRVRITSDPSTMAISFDLSLSDYSLMRVNSKNKDGSFTQEDIKVEWSGGDRKITLNYEYLINLLDAFDDDSLQLKFGDDLSSRPSPILVESEGRRAVMNQLRAGLV